MEKYLDICDQLNLAIDVAFEEYNTNTEKEIKLCPKNFFNYVQSKLKSNNFPSSMYLDQCVGNNSEDICNLFASFFQEIYTSYSEEDRDRDFFEYIPEYPADVGVNHVKVHEILHGLQKLDASKGAGPDGIPPIFMKTLATELTAPLFWLFEISIESRTFPKAWKNSYLVPIFKSGKNQTYVIIVE